MRVSWNVAEGLSKMMNPTQADDQTTLSINNQHMTANSINRFEEQLGNSFEKYAKINGRDVSPPVRLQRKTEPGL